MRDLLFRVFENLQSIFIEQQFLRGQFIGGKKRETQRRQLKEKLTSKWKLSIILS